MPEERLTTAREQYFRDGTLAVAAVSSSRSRAKAHASSRYLPPTRAAIVAADGNRRPEGPGAAAARSRRVRAAISRTLRRSGVRRRARQPGTPRGDRVGGLRRRPKGAANARGGARVQRPDLRARRSTGSKHATACSRRALRQRDPSAPSRVLVVCGSARNDGTCPGEISKTFRLTGLLRETFASLEGAWDVDVLDLSLSPRSTAGRSIPARAASRPRCRSAIGRAPAIRTTRSDRVATG